MGASPLLDDPGKPAGPVRVAGASQGPGGLEYSVPRLPPALPPRGGCRGPEGDVRPPWAAAHPRPGKAARRGAQSFLAGGGVALRGGGCAWRRWPASLSCLRAFSGASSKALMGLVFHFPEHGGSLLAAGQAPAGRCGAAGLRGPQGDAGGERAAPCKAAVLRGSGASAAGRAAWFGDPFLGRARLGHVSVR